MDSLWRVQLSTGEVRMMTIEGIDRAFEEGVINARTHVLAPDTTTWSTLGEAAGLDDEEEDPAFADTVAVNGADLTPSLSPVAIGNVTTPSTPPPASTLPQTPRDLEMLDRDLDLDPDLMMARRKSKAPVVLGIFGAVAVAAAIAVFAGKASSRVADDVKATNAVQAPAAESPLPAADPAKANKPQLNDEQKKKLLDADKARDEKARAKNQEKAEKAERTQKHKATKSGPVFVNGGNKLDPLNGAL